MSKYPNTNVCEWSVPCQSSEISGNLESTIFVYGYNLSASVSKCYSDFTSGRLELRNACGE